jgi:hypothetical protein
MMPFGLINPTTTFCTLMNDIFLEWFDDLLIIYVATLALGSRSKQGFAKVWAKNEARESHFMLPRV